jgi:hypothetical protein
MDVILFSLAPAAKFGYVLTVPTCPSSCWNDMTHDTPCEGLDPRRHCFALPYLFQYVFVLVETCRGTGSPCSCNVCRLI